MIWLYVDGRRHNRISLNFKIEWNARHGIDVAEIQFFCVDRRQSEDWLIDELWHDFKMWRYLTTASIDDVDDGDDRDDRNVAAGGKCHSI